jgi:hypothetical protein
MIYRDFRSPALSEAKPGYGFDRGTAPGFASLNPGYEAGLFES